jgi:PAS domain S-box-containing protein
MIEMANEGIWTLDANNLTDFINAHGAAILGYVPEEMIGRPVTDFVFPENKEEFELMPTNKRQAQVEHYDIRARRKDGSAVWVSSSTSPLFGDDGSYQGAVAMFTDITKQKRAEEESQREHRQLLSIFDSMDEPVYVADPKSYELLYINEAFRHLWGDSMGRKCYNALQNRSAPCPFCTNDQIFGDGHGQTYIWEFQNENNRQWYRCIDRAIEWPDGRDVRFEMAIDITESKKAEIELRRSNAELRQFAYVASHDLQEPLRMVTIYISLLKDRYHDQLDERAKTYMDFAIEGGLRSMDLLRDLLDYSRIDYQESSFAPTNMETVFSTALKNLLLQIRDEEATVTHDPLPTIIADQPQLLQVMQNLLSNAIKFHGDERPKVHVSCKDMGREWLFSVEDNGIGVDPRHADRLFVLFQRLQSAQRYKGTGIGLAICKKIIERHGGRIWFDSQLDKGTTFYFTVPKGPLE